MGSPTAIDLFCGAGGLSLGLRAAGFQVLLAADAWEVASRVYRLNFDHPFVGIDLASASADALWGASGIKPGPVDLVVGGPPCQGFSVQRIGADHDQRNHLVLEFARLVSEFRPRAFLMENVLGLLGKRGKDLAAAFEQRMAESGYSVKAFRVNAVEFGVPQVRRRVMFVGTLRKDGTSYRFPAPTHRPDRYRTVRQAIGDLPSPPIDRSPHPDDRLHRRTRLSPENQMRMEMVPPGGGMQDLAPELRVACHKAGAARIGHRYVYGRMAPDEPAPTITARFDSFTRGKFGHPWEARNITLREGARLQSFPDWFRFDGSQEDIAALIGNAVPPLLAEAVLRHLARTLAHSPEEVPVNTLGQQSLFSGEGRRNA